MAQSVSNVVDPYVGRVLDRQFRITALVGSGAMAKVYRAEQLGVGRDVAVKILRSELLGRQDVAARFRGEAEVAARLDHPHILIVHSVGEVEPAPSTFAEPYVVLEWLEGPSLRRLLDNAGPLPLERALHIVLALSDAVAEAHAHGIVHRDLKPENVMLVRRGSDEDYVKLLDFGLAKRQEPSPDFRTREGSVLGTPRYVSPEGAEGRSVTPASDCYALATLLYECLTGRTPFDGTSAVAILAQQVNAEPPALALTEAGRRVSPAIAEFILRNLSKRPEQREADGRAFGRALVDAARRDGLDARSFGLSPTLLGVSAVRPEQLLAAAPITDSAAVSAVPATGARSKPWLWVFVAACFVLGALAAVSMSTHLDKSKAGNVR